MSYSCAANETVHAPEISEPAGISEKLSDVLVVAPKFTRLLADVLAAEGDCVKLECAVEAKPKPSIRWCQNNKDIVESDRIKASKILYALSSLPYKKEKVLVVYSLSKLLTPFNFFDYQNNKSDDGTRRWYNNSSHRICYF